MSTHAEQVDSSGNKWSGVLARGGYFLWHYVEMCIAMCIGGVVLNVVFFWLAARLGFPNLFEKFPEFSLLMVGIILAIPMIIWMRFRGHEWRPTLEMASTSIILPILLIGAAWLGFIPKERELGLLKTFVCPAMLIPMLLRLDLYTGHHTAHHHVQAAESHEHHHAHTG